MILVNRDGPDPVSCPVVVDRQLPFSEKARNGAPALGVVVQRSGRGRAIGNL